MKAIIRQEKQRTRRRWLIFFGGIGSICYLFILLSTFVLKHNANDASAQASVEDYETSAVRVDAVVAPMSTLTTAPKATITYHADYHPAGQIQRETVQRNAMLPSAPKQSSSQAVKVHTTSSARVHNIGSGVSSGSASGSGTSYVTSSVPFSSSTSSIVMPTAVWTSSRALSAQNTIAAEQQILAENTADASSAPGRNGHIRRIDEWSLDPFMDPLGDNLFALLLAAAVYIGIVFLRKKA